MIDDAHHKNPSKHCPKCGLEKPISNYFDTELKRGKGGYGKICLQCKAEKKLSSGSRNWRIGGNYHTFPTFHLYRWTQTSEGLKPEFMLS